MRLLLKIILSAILFNLGSLSIISLIILYPVFLYEINLKKIFLLGFCWGFIVYSLHFIWLLVLLLSKSQAGCFYSFLIYIFIVLYAAILSGIWFFLNYLLIKLFKKNILKIITFIIITCLYFVFINNYSVWFAGRVEGYPFIGITSLQLPSSPRWLWRTGVHRANKIFYLPPINLQKNKNITPSVVGQHIYHELAKLDLEKYKNKYEKLIVVSPETSYPFPLNKNLDLLKFWGNLLPSNTYLMLGSQRQEYDKIYQTVFYIHGCRIIQYYDKKHSVKFVEKVPKNYKKFTLARSSFLTDKLEFAKSKSKEFSVFEVSDKLRVIPIICSEFFYLDLSSLKTLKEQSKPAQETVIFLFVNDSWFMSYFKDIMKNYVALKSWQLDLPIYYIGHSA